MKRALFAAMASVALVGGTAYANPAQSGYRLCAHLDGTGMTSAPCEVSGFGKSVTATFDMKSGEARTLCREVAAWTLTQGFAFDTGWTLKIVSPYSGGHSDSVLLAG